MIRLTDLRKAYGTLVAVDAISLDIPAGSAFALLGPNGAGKTTTIAMIGGLLRPDSGTVVLGPDAADPALPASRRLIGAVPQALAIYDDLSGEENLRFFGRIHGLRGAELARRIDWALDLVQLADRRRDLADAYSGGMKRRLNIAASLLHDPPILLLDEPTVGVDPQSRNHIFETIERLRAEGRTILYTTHYMEEAERLCERVAIMDHGRILAEDAIAPLLRAHGGDERVVAELDTPPDADLAAALGATIDGNTLTVATRDPFAAIQAIGARHPTLRSLRVERPTLEHVFLNLTGRTLRDA